jgi:peptidoglycan/LPS O-acetylase OafA/YrhL
VFLDLMRFSAAVVVLLHHLTSAELNSILPHVTLGHEAVVVFFVMSGFVIAYVVHGRERSVEQYAAARLGRLYSVVLPALVLTFALDHFGRAAWPALYAGWPDDHALARLAVNGLFLQQNWNLTVMPLSNGPFWSLGYEFWYYVIFGAAVLWRGRAGMAAALLACLLAGPRIVAAFPIWLLGVWAFRTSSTWRPAAAVARGVFWGASAAMVALLAFGNPLRPSRDAIGQWLGGDGFFSVAGFRIFAGDIPRLPEDLLLGCAFAAMILSAGPAWGQRPPPARVASAIRYLAGSTFTLYLMHVPLLYGLVALFHVGKEDAAALLAVGATVLGCCFVLSYAGERQVAGYRAAFLRLFERIRARGAQLQPQGGGSPPAP